MDKTKQGVVVAQYLGANILANLLLLFFGPAMTLFNATVFIGFDLTTRDRLHSVWAGRGLFWKMGALIAAGGFASWAISGGGAGPIALGSALAFFASGAADAVAYGLLGRYAPMLRVNGSNIVSALVDSVVFPLVVNAVAPVPFFPVAILGPLILGQFAVKVFGGAMWSFLLRRHIQKEAPQWS